jgi:hypothetical protein
MSKPNPQVGDIWKWDWESGKSAYVLLIENTEDKTMFFGRDLEFGDSQLWDFHEAYLEGWTFIA